MSRSAQTVLAVLAVVSAISSPATLSATRPAAAPAGRTAAASADVQNAWLKTPLRFERRGGVSDAAGNRFVARGIGYAVSIAPDGATVLLSGPGSTASAISMRLAGGRADAAASVDGQLAGRTNQLIGNDPRQWKLGIPAYGRVRYHDVYPKIDLVYYGNQHQLEYDFVVAPGASPGSIAFEIQGAERVSVEKDGDLQIATAAGALTHRAPVLYQELDGRRTSVSGGYIVVSTGANYRVTFEVGDYDTRRPLIIDPVLNYATYLGGVAEERVHGVVVDAGGNVIIAGETYSPDFPTAGSSQVSGYGYGDAFVAKLTPAGDALVYATYIGGMAQDAAAAVDVDAAGAVYVTGSTFSSNFPTMNAIQPSNNGQADAFVLKLDANGALVYSTLLGGTLEDYASGIAVDAFGRAHVAGATASANFPVANPFQPTLGGSPVFRTQNGGETWTAVGGGLRTIGVRAFAIDRSSPETLFAGTEAEGVFKSTDRGTTWMPTGGELSGLQVNALALADGTPATVFAATQAGIFRSRDGGDSWTHVMSGWATSVVLSPESASTVYAGLSWNGYPFGVMKSVDGGDSWIDTGLVDGISALSVSRSTVYAAGSGGIFSSINGENWVAASAGPASQVTALVADARDAATAYAATWDGLFKTVDGGVTWTLMPMLSGNPIAAMAISTSDPSTLMVSLMWGGTAITHNGGEYWNLTGSPSTAFSAIAFQPGTRSTAYLGGAMNRDAFVATIGADGHALEFSTFFGGGGSERATDIGTDAYGARYIVGETTSVDLPLSNPVRSTFGGLQDAFAARLGPEGLSYSTYLGGSGFDSTPKVAVDPMGQAHIAGLTWSLDYPMLNAQQPHHAGGYADVFLSVLNPQGAFVHSTYLGGSAAETDPSQSLGPDVAVSGSGETYVTGTTMSADFPASEDAVQPLHAGGQNDAFVTGYDYAGRLLFSTYLGGSGDDYGRSVAIDVDGGIAVAGYTSSANFPVRTPLQPASAGSDEAFIARIGLESAPSDTVAPVTTVTIEGTQGLNGWYRSNVIVTLTATDEEGGSGVASVLYSVNGGALQTYPGPTRIYEEGVNTLTVQATDMAGNVETPSSSPVNIDSRAPAVTIASPQAREYLFSASVNVSVSVGEINSGLAGPAAITVDGVPLAGSVLNMATLALGPHTLTASAADIAGNTTQRSVTFMVVTELDTVIRVPAEVPTIQAAIDAAENGFTVLVAPGTYLETIDFRGKAITVISEAGAAATIVDARGAGSVVTFRSGETRASVLSGFTLRGGLHANFGGGVYIASASPTVQANVITDNRSCTGVGVYSSFGSPLVQGNRITRNSVSGCTGGWGIGVYIGGDSSAELLDNEITENTGEAASGGGVALFAAGKATVRGNLIARNATSGAAGCGWGGGIATANFAEAKIVGNVITGNSACSGGGIYWLGSTGVSVFVNNTIADNDAASWPGVYVSGFDSRNQVFNNIVTAKSGPAFYCQNSATVSSPTLNSNNVYSAQGAAYGGTCADHTGLNGNVSADPGFLRPLAGDYRVGMLSVAVDGGNDAAPLLPQADITGQPRVVDGNGDGVARVDIGALEYRNRTPVVDAGADQTIAAGANCEGQVTLTGMANDRDGDAVTLSWSTPFGTVSGQSLSLDLPVGTYVFTLTAQDVNGGSASDTVVVTIVDRTAPVITSIAATPSVVTKSNHEMVPVVVTVNATDGCGAVDCRIVSVSSNETGVDDWQITGKLTLHVKAERNGRGTGRVYTVTVACTDAAGNVSTSTVTVTVPK